MTTCKKCGTRCLGNEQPEDCNNCNEVISSLISYVASHPVPEHDEWDFIPTRTGYRVK